MNCNLVTKLKIQCFNSLFYCRAADLFKQIFLCLISTVNMYAAVFMQEAEAAAGGSFFTVQAPTALWMWEKTTFFCPLLSNQTGTKGTAAQVRSYSTLPRRCSWRGVGHNGSVPTAPCCPLSWAGHGEAGQNPPQVLSTSQRQNLGPVKAKISSPSMPWAEGVLSPWGGAGAEGWELSQALPFSGAVI